MVSDFSHFALWLAGLATVAQAYTAPVGDTPSGNPIAKPGLNEVVPAGSPYAITWSPTTTDCSTVDLILLRGPSTDIKYLSTIVEAAANTGSFSWTPASTLEPDTTHYGIQLICTQSGAYQYTTQFGISNPSYSSASSSSSASATSSSAGGFTSTRSVHLASSSSSIAPSTSSPASSSSAWSSVLLSTAPAPSSYASGGFPVAGNSTIAHPSGTVSHSFKTSGKPTTSTKVLTKTNTPTSTVAPTSGTSSTSAPAGTNGASAVQAAFGLMGAAVAAVYLL